MIMLLIIMNLLMYVCICHALTDADVESAETNGAKNTNEVFDHYGVRPQCGRCVPTMRCLMKCQQQGKPACLREPVEAERRTVGARTCSATPIDDEAPAEAKSLHAS